MNLELNEQQKDFLAELLAREYEQDENDPRSNTHRQIAYQLLEKIQNDNEN